MVKQQLTIGVDTGGTFTDLVAVDESGVRAEKLPSTPDDPARAVLAGIAKLGGAARGSEVVHARLERQPLLRIPLQDPRVTS